MSGYARCNKPGCGMDILFARTIPGKKLMPIDPGTAPDDEPYANLAVRRDHLGSIYVRVLKKDEVPMVTERRGVPHFATCLARPKPKTAATEQAPKTAASQPLPDNVLPFRRS